MKNAILILTSLLVLSGSVHAEDETGTATITVGATVLSTVLVNDWLNKKEHSGPDAEKLRVICDSMDADTQSYILTHEDVIESLASRKPLFQTEEKVASALKLLSYKGQPISMKMINWCVDDIKYRQ